jgi:hypothetical protein
MKTAGDAGTNATDAVAKENSTLAGSATMRIPNRSTRRPKNGVAIPVTQSPMTMAEEAMPRLQPNPRQMRIRSTTGSTVAPEKSPPN